MHSSRYRMIYEVSSRRYLKLRLGAVALGVAIFVIDTVTSVEGAVAVLYLLPLLIAAETLEPRRIIALGVFCGALTLLSFCLVHFPAAGASEWLRLAVSLAATAVTTALLARDHAKRRLLIDLSREASQNEWRYRSIFERSPVALWEQDYSRAIPMLEGLREIGVRDLADYEAQTPGLLQALTDAITTTDVNDAMTEVLGATSRSAAIQATMTELKPNPATMLGIMQAVFEGRTEFSGEGALLGLDGRIRTVLVAKSFPPDIASTGRVVGTLVDVTLREQAQEAMRIARAELARASRAATIGALSASIAHELNQPLGAIVMNAQTCLRWLQKTPPDVDGAYAAAERAASAGKRASEIVRETRDLLTNRPPRDEVVNLRELALEVVSLLDKEISEHGVTLHADLDADAPLISADRVSLQQVLVNLITNALHSMADCPTNSREIRVYLDKPDEDHIRLVVKDRGHGITDEAMTRLFEPFFTTKHGGMGMGLAISRMAVEACGGRLQASNHEDGGAQFECLLPTKKEVESA